jgi:hypothetical protein
MFGSGMKTIAAVSLAVITFGSLCGSIMAQTSPTQSASSQSGVEGTITISPTHGGPTRIGVSNSRPLASTDFSVQNEKGEEITSFKTDDQGHFRVVLPPGHYKVTNKANRKIGFFGPFEADVSPSQMTKVEWQCDSGMR